MTKAKLTATFQSEHDRLTRLLGLTLDGNTALNEGKIRAALFEVENLAAILGIDLVNNFNPLPNTYQIGD